MRRVLAVVVALWLGTAVGLAAVAQLPAHRHVEPAMWLEEQLTFRGELRTPWSWMGWRERRSNPWIRRWTEPEAPRFE